MHTLTCNERRRHGTPGFPLAYYHIDGSHPRYNMPFHWHMEWEIIRVLEGHFRLYLDEEEILAAAGDVVCVAGGVVHGGAPEDCVYECAVFDLASLLPPADDCRRALALLTKHERAVSQHIPAGDGAIGRAAARFFAAARRHPGEGSVPRADARGADGGLEALGALYELLGAAFNRGLCAPVPPGVGGGRRKMAQLKPVLEYIESSYEKPITLDDLSRIAGMSPKYFCRCFGAVIHRTPMDYLNFYRIERACSQLCATDLSVTDVAYACGFNDTSYFIRTFRRYKSTTPNQYRARTG